MYLGDYAAGGIIDFFWSTNAADGSSITRSAKGTVSVYRDNSDAQTTTGVTDDKDFDSVTGVHHCRISFDADEDFYVSGSDYAVVLSGGTIDGKTVNAVLGLFSIENRSQPALPGALSADGIREAIGMAAANLDGQLALLPQAEDMVSATDFIGLLDASVVDGTITKLQADRLMLAVLTGKTTGAGTETVSFIGMDNTTTRVQATMSGKDRSSVTRTGD